MGVDIDTKTMTMGKNAPDSSRRDNKSCITSLLGNAKTGKVEVNTLIRDEPSPGIDINEIGQQQDFAEHKKPQLHDAPIDIKTMLDLEKLFEKNKDAFAEDERQIGTTPLIKMSIDTGDA